MSRSNSSVPDGNLTLADFRGSGSAVAHDERRSETRVSCDRQVDVLPSVAGRHDWQFKRMRLIDCSPHGLGLISDQPVEAGEQFAVKLKVQRIVLVLYTVRHCQPLANGRNGYKIGAKFSGFFGTPEHCDPDEIFQALLEAAKGDTGTELRLGLDRNESRIG